MESKLAKGKTYLRRQGALYLMLLPGMLLLILFKYVPMYGVLMSFRNFKVRTGIWSGVGYGSIIYLAAISGIGPELYESAIIDGATRMQQIKYITLPCIAPTIIIMFIFAMGGILGNDYQKILLMQSHKVLWRLVFTSTVTHEEVINGDTSS